MSFLLTKEQIRALYDVNGKGEVVAYGRNVTNIVKNPARRKLTLDDFGSNGTTSTTTGYGRHHRNPPSARL